jgi:hypothetical protein
MLFNMLRSRYQVLKGGKLLTTRHSAIPTLREPSQECQSVGDIADAMTAMAQASPELSPVKLALAKRLAAAQVAPTEEASG